MRHVCLLLSCVTAITWPSTASAQQTLWGRVTVGMTKEAFKATYPDRKFDLGNGCHAFISPEYDGKLVYEVTLDGSWEDPFNCAKDISASLVAKYGAPRSEDVSIERASIPTYAGGGLKRLRRLQQLDASDTKSTLDRVKTVTWFTGDTLVTLRLNETLYTWSVRYQQASIKKPAITDKL